MKERPGRRGLKILEDLEKIKDYYKTRTKDDDYH